MIGSVAALHTLRHASDFGLSAENVTFDFTKVMGRKEKIVKQLTGGVGYLLKKHKIRHVRGFGSVVDANTVKVVAADGTSETITTSAIVLATGSVPTKV
ncbi:MAG: dihydrolipoyl dehydrogenase, partial [Armatimonadaceae bacterium]